MVQQENDNLKSWKRNAYTLGGLFGLTMGLLSAHLYTRAAEENLSDEGDPPQVPTMTLIGVLLSAMALLRQIAEIGKPNNKPGKK